MPMTTATTCATCWGPLSTWALLAFLVLTAVLVRWAWREHRRDPMCWDCYAGRHHACAGCGCCGQ